MSVNSYVTKSGKKKWYANIYISQREGRLRKYGFDKKSDALKYENVLKTSIKYLGDGAYRLGDVFEAMMLEKSKGAHPISLTTSSYYYEEFGKLFTPKSVVKPKTRLILIKPENLQRILDQRTKYTLGKRSLKFMQMLFRYIRDHDYLPKDLSAQLFLDTTIKKTKDAKKHERKMSLKRNWLDDKERLQFERRLKSMDDENMNKMDKVQLILALNVGLRDSETRGLLLKDIEKTDDGMTVLHVNRQFNQNNEYTKTKTGNKRVVPIPRRVSNLLYEYTNDYKVKLYKSKGWKLTENSPLFTAQSSKEEIPIPKTHTNELLKKFNRRNPDINKISSHGLRHTFASYLYNTDKMTVDEISILLGHSNIQTTQRYYIHQFHIKQESISKKLFSIDDDNESDNNENKDE